MSALRAGAGAGHASHHGQTPILEVAFSQSPPTCAERPHPDALPPAALALLRGRRLIYPDTLQLLAELGDDDIWRDADGIPVESITIPALRASARPDAARAAEERREHDQQWLAGALAAVRSLAEQHAEITTEDVRAALSSMPRDPRSGLSTLMNRAAEHSYIARTDATTPCRRRQSGGRRLRVWRSLLFVEPVERMRHRR